MGRSPRERRRLQAQGKIYAEPTAELLRMAGVRPGMRILDVGCGAGDVTLQAAAIAGPGGSALGVDEDREVLAVAAQRAQAAGLRKVSFERARVPDELSAVLDEPVDAVVGRLILLHLEDPAGAVAALKGVVRPGGLLSHSRISTSAAVVASRLTR
jgi:ubiquinone/menaquinone biosynthesis C-methylase UbiE